jgi:16S rRNA G527 N7-methylase RsmG
LSELQPHVVVKLIEGRGKRIKFLEQALRAKMKDIEQRSLETCAVNAAHLEQFQKKATDNEKTAEAMTAAAAQNVLKHLLIS